MENRAGNPFVYWGSGSPPCWKVLLVLEEKKVKGYGRKLLEFSKKEHKSEEVTKLNPRGQVPTFYDGDIVINESTAACMYLEWKYKEQGETLMPDEPAQRALVLQRMMETANISTNVIVPVVYMKKPGEEVDQSVLTEKKEKANKELALWEGYLQMTGGYIAGNSFTMADIFLYPLIATLVRQGADLKVRYPNLDRYYNTLTERPSIKATRPPHWVGTEGPGGMKDLCA